MNRTPDPGPGQRAASAGPTPLDAAAFPAALPPAERLRLASGQRLTTPGGQGELVWHRWGTRRAGQPPVVLLLGVRL